MTNRYSMIFAMGPDFRDIILLRKPSNHKNPLFRDKWTVPGGLIEEGETDTEGATRELWEESQIQVAPADLVPVLKFLCNCDATEPEHEIAVFGVIVPVGQLLKAKGEITEPVTVVRDLPENLLWYVEPLFDLVKARMRQPLKTTRDATGAEVLQ